MGNYFDLRWQTQRGQRVLWPRRSHVGIADKLGRVLLIMGQSCIRLMRSEDPRSPFRIAANRKHPLELERIQHSLNHHSSLPWRERKSQRGENVMEHIRTIFTRLKKYAVWRITGRGGLKKSIIQNAIAMTLAPLMSLTLVLQSQNARADNGL